MLFHLDWPQIGRAAVLVGQGLTAAEIAEAMKVSVQDVRTALSIMGVRAPPKPFGIRDIPVRLRGRDIATLKAEAAKRGMTHEALASKMSVVLNDKMVAAVVDE